MTLDKLLIEHLADLKREISHLNPICYNYKEFSQKSNTIQQAQANSIIKFLVKISNKLDDLDNRLNKLQNNFQTFRKNKESVSNLELSNSLDNLDRELDILTNGLEKLNLSGPILACKTIDIKYILGLKVILKSN